MTLFQCKNYPNKPESILFEYKSILKKKIEDLYNNDYFKYIKDTYTLDYLFRCVDNIACDNNRIYIYEIKSSRVLRLLEYGSDKIQAFHLLLNTSRVLEGRLGGKSGI